jgi:cobalt/nickel transport system ATP-binding protein
MSNEPILSIKDLKYTYSGGDHEALKGISLDVMPGERICIVGNNGAGKSTFFLNVNGVLHPDSGEIYFKGQKVEDNRASLNELRRGVGIVFQDADNQIIASTVMGEVSFGPINLGLDNDEVEKRVDEALAEMNLSEFKHRAPHYCSGGEKKRITIADIIAMHSEVIIFDEPTAALDPLNAKMLEEALTKLAAQNKTLLISTHDMDFAYRWAQKLVVFSDGQIIATGTPVEVLTNREICEQANLRKPMLMRVYEDMVKHGIAPDDKAYPQDVAAFDQWLESIKAS